MWNKNKAENQEGADAPDEPLFSLQGVTKRFGATTALDHVSMDFLRGEIHCVLGENGAGKSTIAKIIGGIHAQDEGRTLRSGRAVSFRDVHESRASGVAMVFQELSLAPDLSVRANLHLGAAHAGVFGLLNGKQEAQAVEQVLERLNCDVDMEAQIKDLPVATQQLIEIAKALMQEPELIVLDEPTAMLGAVEKQKLFGVARALRDEGKALVLITHHIEDVMELADRVSIMSNGRLVDSFPMSDAIGPDDLLERLTGGRAARSSPSSCRQQNGEIVLAIENYPRYSGPSVPMQVPRGAIIGLYGVVGCGALDIIHALAGVRGSSFLRFTLEGREFAPHSPAQAIAKGVSYLPSGRASNGIFQSLSVRENLSLTMLGRLGRWGVVSERAERMEVDHLLSHFSVKYRSMDDSIGSLSGGNQQKVLMARAMARARNILLLEEPTAGIDVGAKAQLHEHIRALAQTGVAILLLSSDLMETIQLCDAVYTFYDERIRSCYESPSLEDQGDIVSDVLGQQSGGEAADANHGPARSRAGSRRHAGGPPPRAG